MDKQGPGTSDQSDCTCVQADQSLHQGAQIKKHKFTHVVADRIYSGQVQKKKIIFVSSTILKVKATFVKQ